MSNLNLNKAKQAKNDEFYTQIEDIEKEIINYKDYLQGKVIYCNCDDPRKSNFWKYFHLNFSNFKLSGLIATFFSDNNDSFKAVYTGGNDDDITAYDKVMLDDNGDFRSEECINLLCQADIVVTNPPFSLFRDLIAVLTKCNKDFIVLGSINVITYKNVFPLIKENRLHLGCNSVKKFKMADGSFKLFGNVCWFSTIGNNNSNFITLNKKYNLKDYPKYDNYDAIDVSSVGDIPEDYFGVMGVPITFLDKYNPDQFELIGITNNGDMSGIPFVNNCFAEIKGKRLYVRLLIKRK